MIVKIVDKVDDYKKAIEMSCNILEARGSIEKSYFDAIMKKIDDYGAYFCIAPKLAMPHARPEDGAIKTDLCVLKLNEPVDFLGKETSLFLTLSSIDNNSHLALMQKVASICMDECKLNKILNSNKEEEIMEVI